MKIRFTKDVEYTILDSNGESQDRNFRRWQELMVEDVSKIGGHYFTITLPGGAEVLDVREDSFIIVDKS